MFQYIVYPINILLPYRVRASPNLGALTISAQRRRVLDAPLVQGAGQTLVVVPPGAAGCGPGDPPVRALQLGSGYAEATGVKGSDLVRCRNPGAIRATSAPVSGIQKACGRGA